MWHKRGRLFVKVQKCGMCTLICVLLFKQYHGVRSPRLDDNKAQQNPKTLLPHRGRQRDSSILAANSSGQMAPATASRCNESLFRALSINKQTKCCTAGIGPCSSAQAAAVHTALENTTPLRAVHRWTAFCSATFRSLQRRGAPAKRPFPTPCEVYATSMPHAW